MAKFELFTKTAMDFAHIADFLTIYIDEAHPPDGWSFGNNYNIKSPTSLQERIEAAHILLGESRPFKIVVDAMDDNANTAYGVLSDRLYIILDGVCVFQGGAGPYYYYVEEVIDWLSNFDGSR